MASSKRATDNEEGAPLGVLAVGLLLLATGAFATVSVCGYYSTDENLILPGYGSTMHNPCGIVGATAAYHLLSTYGLAGYLLPLLLFFWGFHVLVRRRFESHWRKLGGGLLLVAALSTLCGALSSDWKWLYDAVDGLNLPVSGRVAGELRPPRAGGLLGHFGASVLRPPFGPVGIYLIVGGAGFLAMVLAAQQSVEWALAAVGRGAVGGLRAGYARLCAGVFTRRRDVDEDDEVYDVPAASRRKRGRARGSVPSVRATFGQSEEEMKRGQKAPGLEEPTITIARVTEPPPPPESDAERDAREKQEIADLQARASGPRPAADDVVPPPLILEETPPPPPVVRNMSSAADDAEVEEEQERPARKRSPKGTRGPKQARKKPKAKPKARVKIIPPAEPKPEAMPDPVDYSGYELPKVGLLDKVEHQAQVTNEVLTNRGQVLVDTLKEFRIITRLVSIDRGPAVTIYELELAPGIRVQRVMELADNLAMAMRAPNVRIIAPIPGRDTIGIEVPNTEREVVRLRPILESKEFRSRTKDMAIPFVIGRDAAGEVLVQDLTRMPHLLVAGATGSGKSVCLNSFIGTMLMTRSPAQVKLLLVDPKMVEMTQYKGIPHLITPVITDMKRAAGVFEWATKKMEERYEMLSTCACRDISRFNKMGSGERLKRAEAADVDDRERFAEDMPYLVIIVDELADLMMLASKEIERSITRLAQKSRGVGIHIILATQRPSVDVVTGLIKTNMPARIAFQVSSKVDSRTIIDQNGAEKLMGMGDMLYLPPTTSALVRAKGTYVSDEEVARIVIHSKVQAKPDFIPELENVVAGGGDSGGAGGGLSDELFDEAVQVVLETRRGSVSLLQRRLGIGYTRAAKLIDMMAERDILGPYRGSKPREILISMEEWESGVITSGPVAGQREDERPPEDVPGADDYNESEEFPEYEEDSEEESELATSTSGRLA
ncbi:MAG: FtsK/SpoIIIE family DNA translocase [Planctomycetota bacterium]|jgi:S-DNA-T family DNA segregation ATPase FtsK/SpoIIIE